MSVLAFTSACQESPSQPAALDREFVLAPGETAEIAEASTTIRFNGVLSDSRCPTDVQCIQAGDAVVQLHVTGPVDEGEYELHTETRQPVQHGDVTIALVDLQPRPVSTERIRPEDYRVRLRVTR